MKLIQSIFFIFCGFNPSFGIFFSPDGPESVGKNVKIYFSTSLYEAYRYDLINLWKVYNNEKFQRGLPTAIFIHGFQETGTRDYSAMAIRSAYRDRGDHNVITIDWSFYSKSYFYKNSVIPQLKIICETVAENLLMFFKQGYQVEKVHLVGHSLGGQCIGLVSRHLKTLSENQFVIPRLFALDPAAPGFEDNNFFTSIYSWITFHKSDFDMISSSDARYVQIIHTSAGSYGIASNRGHVDFFPNAGFNQAGCDLEFPGLRDVCSHRRAWLYYQESVRNPNAFIAIKCVSYENFIKRECENETAFMGFSSDTEVKGNFYLMTHPNPFGSVSLGKEGLEFKKMRIITESGEDDGESFLQQTLASPFGVKLHDDMSHVIIEETFLENF